MDLNSLVESSIQDTLASVWFTSNGPPPLAPELILCVTILGLLLVRLVPFGKLVDAGGLAIVGLCFAIYYGADWTQSIVASPAREVCGGMMVFDSFTVCIRLILLFFTILFIVFTKLSGTPPREDGTDFYCLVLGALLGMSLMASANHLLMVFLSVEMASVPSYVLVGIKRGERGASEASLKYSIYGAGAAGVMLYGISLLAGLTNTAHLPSIAVQLAGSLGEMSRPEQIVLVLAALMIMVGLAFKLSAVPFHFWCPDVFEGGTAEIAAFLSIASKAGALALLVRVSLGIGLLGPERLGAADAAPGQATVEVATGVNGLFAVEDEVSPAAGPEHVEQEHGVGETAGDPLTPIRTFLGLLIGTIAVVTTTFGNLAAYGQTNIKRLLAYSTIAHAGYMMMPVPAALAVAAVSPESARDAIAAIVLYVGIYMFMNLGAFGIVAFLRNSLGTEEIADYGGLIRRAPVVVVCMALIMFSLVGLPPLAGFIGKFALFGALADAYNTTGQTYLIVLLVLGGINTAISLFYYLRVVKVMAMDPESDVVSTHNGAIVDALPLSFIVLMTIPVALLIINWKFLADLSDSAAHQLFG